MFFWMPNFIKYDVDSCFDEKKVQAEYEDLHIIDSKLSFLRLVNSDLKLF